MPPKWGGQRPQDRETLTVALDSINSRVREDAITTLNCYLAVGFAPEVTSDRIDDLPQDFVDPENLSNLIAFTASWNALWTAYHFGDDYADEYLPDAPPRAPYTPREMAMLLTTDEYRVVLNRWATLRYRRDGILAPTPQQLANMTNQLSHRRQITDAHLDALLAVLNSRHSMKYTLGLLDEDRSQISIRREHHPVVWMSRRRERDPRRVGIRGRGGYRDHSTGFTYHPAAVDVATGTLLNTYTNTRRRDAQALVDQGLYRLRTPYPPLNFWNNPGERALSPNTRREIPRRAEGKIGQFVVVNSGAARSSADHDPPRSFFNALVRPYIFEPAGDRAEWINPLNLVQIEEVDRADMPGDRGEDLNDEEREAEEAKALLEELPFVGQEFPILGNDIVPGARRMYDPVTRELYWPEEFEAETAEEKTQIRYGYLVKNRTRITALKKSRAKLGGGDGIAKFPRPVKRVQNRNKWAGRTRSLKR